MKVEIGAKLLIPVEVINISKSGETVQLKTKDNKMLIFCSMKEIESLCIDSGTNSECDIKTKAPDKNIHRKFNANKKYAEYLALPKDTKLFQKHKGYILFLNSIDEDGATLTDRHSKFSPDIGINVELEDIAENFIVVKFNDGDIIRDHITGFFEVLHTLGGYYFIRNLSTGEIFSKLNIDTVNKSFTKFKVPEINTVLIHKDLGIGFKVKSFSFKETTLESSKHLMTIPTRELYMLFFTPTFEAGDTVEHYSTEMKALVIAIDRDNGYIVRIEGDTFNSAINFKNISQYKKVELGR